MGIGSTLRWLTGRDETKTGALRADDAKAARLWGRLFGYGDAAAGKPVTPETAMQVSAFWACVKLLSETVATLPLGVYRRERDGGRTVATDHPVGNLLRISPDGEHTAVEFWEGAMIALCISGDAFAEKVRNRGTLIALHPMQADLVTVRRAANGRLVYDYRDPRGFRSLDEDDMFHLRAFGGAGLRGFSPLQFARQTLSASIAADEVAGKLFANGARPSGVLTIDQVLKGDQRKDIRENVVGPLVGSSNAGGIFVLEAGMKFSPLSLTPEDSQLLETRRWHVEEIARWFGIPPILIGHAAQGQTMWGTGVEQIGLSWLTLGLRAQLKRIEAAISLRLLDAEERAEIYAEFSVEGLLRADSAGRAKLYASYAQNGIMDRDEIRQKENLPVRGGGAAKLTVQSNLLPVDDLGVVAVMPRERPVQPGAADAESEDDEVGAPEGKAIQIVRLLPAPAVSVPAAAVSEVEAVDLDALDARADAIKAWSPDQLRDALGRWGSGGGSGSSGGGSSGGSGGKAPAAAAKETAADKKERQAYHGSLLKAAATGAVIAGIGTAAALAGGPGAARIALAVTSIAEQFVVADMMMLAVRHAAHREGISGANLRAKIEGLATRIGLKAAAAPSGALKRVQADLVEAADAGIDALQAQIARAKAGLDPTAVEEGVAAIAQFRADVLARIEALTDDDLVPDEDPADEAA